MTGRGSSLLPPERPVSPLDPTLTTNPVPRKRTFSLRSFGPGSASNIETLTTHISPLLSTTLESTYIQPPGTSSAWATYAEVFDEPKRLLRELEHWERTSWRSDERLPPLDPTWGFYAFVTAYDAQSVEALPRAMENWVRVQVRRLEHACTLPAFRHEVEQRFKLSIIVDEKLLDGASDDRVRAEFRALYRGLELVDEGEEDDFVPPARNFVCFDLDAKAIDMLATLEFSEDAKGDGSAFGKKKVKVLDIRWQRPEKSRSAHRGVGHVGISSLASLWTRMTSGVDGMGLGGDHHLDGPE